MTTHDQHTDYEQSLDPSNDRRPADRQAYAAGQGAAPEYGQNDGYAEPLDEGLGHSRDDRMNQPSGDHLSQQVSATDPSDVQGVSSGAADTRASGGSSSSIGDDLFADDEMVGLRARWDSVQASFVDDPKECVQKADVLVSDVVDQLTSSFSHARSALEEQWARGEEASTEDLRIALKRYRDFFDRLLAV